MILLQSVILEAAGAVLHPSAERRADRPRVGTVPVRGNPVGRYARNRLGLILFLFFCDHVELLVYIVQELLLFFLLLKLKWPS